MGIEEQAENMARVAEARQAMPDVLESLALMAEWANVQLAALKRAGVDDADAQQIVVRWWSDSLRGQS
jgi:hypothetical protein